MNRTQLAATRSALTFVAGAALAGLLVLGACSTSPELAQETVAPLAPTEAVARAETPEASERAATTETDESAPAESGLAPAPTPEQKPESQPEQSAASPQLAIDQIEPALQPVVTGLDQPLFVTHAGDGSGRLFIVEKPGVVRILRRATSTPRLRHPRPQAVPP